MELKISKEEAEELSPMLKAAGIIKIIPLTEGENNETAKVVTRAGTFLLKMSDREPQHLNRDSFGYLERWRRANYHCDNVIFQDCLELGDGYAVFKWIDGVNDERLITQKALDWIFQQKAAKNADERLVAILQAESALYDRFDVGLEIQHTRKTVDYLIVYAHNDLKPENCLVKDDKLVILDNEYFGINLYGADLCCFDDEIIADYLATKRPKFTRKQWVTLEFVLRFLDKTSALAALLGLERKDKLKL